MPIFGMRDRNGRLVYPWDRREIASSAHWRQGESLLRRSTELIATYERFAKRERKATIVNLVCVLISVVWMLVCVAMGTFDWWNTANVLAGLYNAWMALKWGRLWRESVRSQRDIRAIRTSVAAKMAGYTPPGERN